MALNVWYMASLAGQCCTVRWFSIAHIGSILIQAKPDTVYACQDIKDDVKMGVRSTAILFGSWIRPLLVLCGLMFVTMLAVAGYLNRQGPAYFIVSVGGTAAHLLWQYMTVDLGIPKSCWSEFFFSKTPPPFSHLSTRKLCSQRPTWMDCVGRIDARLSQCPILRTLSSVATSMTRCWPNAIYLYPFACVSFVPNGR